LTLRHLALIPFLAGVLILAYYYLLVRPKEAAAGADNAAVEKELQPLVTPTSSTTQAV
jgi:hypothetical protein